MFYLGQGEIYSGMGAAQVGYVVIIVLVFIERNLLHFGPVITQNFVRKISKINLTNDIHRKAQ